MANQLILDRALDANGYVIMDGAKATVYASGTSILLPVYSDVGAGVPAANPIVADGSGFWPQRFVAEAAKVVVTDANDVTLYTLDPAPTALGSGSAASEVSFSPTVELPQTNVQAAIEAAAASAASGYAAFGLGITGNAALLANIDATNTAAGTYRFDGTTTGTYPTGVSASDTGLIEQWRQSATVGMMELHHATTNRRFRRRLTAGAWGAWRENVEVNIGAARGDLIRRGATDWERVALGSNGQVLTSNGTDAVWAAGGYSMVGPVATTSGTTVNLSTAISTSARQIHVSLDGVSTNGTQPVGIRVGNASFLTTGYNGAAGMSGDGFGAYVSRFNLSSLTTGTGLMTGHAVLTRMSATRWSFLANCGRGVGDVVHISTGWIDVTGGIDRLQLQAGGDTFDAGNAYVSWIV